MPNLNSFAYLIDNSERDSDLTESYRYLCNLSGKEYEFFKIVNWNRSNFNNLNQTFNDAYSFVKSINNKIGSLNESFSELKQKLVDKDLKLQELIDNFK